MVQIFICSLTCIKTFIVFQKIPISLFMRDAEASKKYSINILGIYLFPYVL